MDAMITVSDKARDHLVKLREESKANLAYSLRIGIKGGGCSGLTYTLDFDNEFNPGDQAFEDKGIKMIIDMKSLLYLAGTELDFSDGLNGKGFHFSNPNASRTCGCGESFGV